MTDVTCLPRGNEGISFDIIAPTDGLDVPLSEYLENHHECLDLEIENDNCHANMRVIPLRDSVRWDTRREAVFYVDAGVGVFLDEDGSETDELFKVWLYINLEVRSEGLPTGKLKIWRIRDSEYESLSAER